MRTAIVDDPIDPAALLREVSRPANGAALLFVGTVRDISDGRAVDGIDYTAYRPMAERELRAIVMEAGKAFGAHDIVVEHRIGSLLLEDVSVAIAVATPHRAMAYEASRFVIEELKKRVPIWKSERYVTESRRDWRRTPESSAVLSIRSSGEVDVINARIPGEPK